MSGEHRALPRVLQFMQRLWELDHALQSRSKLMERQLGITGPQRLTIRLLGERPGMTPSELAETLRLHRSTLTGVLQRLEEQGAVTRKSNPKDLRSAALFLTPRGQTLNGIREGTVEDVVSILLEELDDDAASVFQSVLGKLTERLEEPARFRTVGRSSKRGRRRPAVRDGE